MKKIVYIGNNLSKNTKYTPMLFTLSNFFKEEGYAVVVASNKMNKFRRLFDMVLTVLKHQKDTDFVLIDTFGAANFYFAVLISQLSRLLRLKYIPILRGGNLPLRFSRNPVLSKLLFGNSYVNVTPSSFLSEELLKIGFSAMVIPNTIEIDNYKFSQRKVYQPHLLFVRAFHQIYNPTMAVQVLYKVLQQYPEASLCMIGPEKDESLKATKDLAQKLGISNKIIFTGVLSKEAWHKKSEDYDIFINTTTIDNTPVSVMEAMAMGIPVVSTNVGGIPYLLEDGKDAYLVPSNDVDAMSERIIAIIEQQADVELVVNKAREKVAQFDWAVVRLQWISLLESVELKKQQRWTQKLYDKSPVFVQNMLITFYGFYWKNRRLGGNFKKYIQHFQKHESFTEEQWIAYQTKELRTLLVHAFETVPFYKELYTKHGFDKERLSKFTLEDLKLLPFLEKEDLRKYGKTTLLSTKAAKGRFYSSSGSTGTPVEIFISKNFHQKWNALYELRVRNWAGVHHKMGRAMIGGRRIIPTAISEPPFYRYNKAESQVYFSAYHISEKTTKDYVEGLFKYEIKYFVGYAMSIYLLSKNIKKLGLTAPKLLAVLTSSEKLTNEMRVVIEEVFQCKVFDAYSGVEACGLISENKWGELFFSSDSGIMEVLNKDGHEVGLGESGEVVATGLLNFSQPLIRYRIGDSVKKALNQESSLSNCHMLKIDEIEGRIEDVVIGSEGQKMVRFHSVFIGISAIVMAQVIQISTQEILIKLVVDAPYNRESELVISQRIQSQLGNVMVDFLYVDTIEKTSTGKFKAVISNLENV